MPKRALFPILLLAAAGAGAAPPPGFRGRVLRRDSEAGARYTETAPPGEGPGILVTWPPLQRKEVRGNRIRIAAATLPGARAFVNGREVTVFPTGAFVSLIPLRPGENSVDITTRDERGETNHRFRILKSDATEAPPPISPSRRSGAAVPARTASPSSPCPGGAGSRPCPQASSSVWRGRRATI